MKTLDVDAFHENIQAILDSIKSQKEQIQGLISQVQAFSSLDDAFKGQGGEAIRSFYETGHASFLTLYHSLLTSYEARLTQITHALRSFEPSEDGYITQPFLQDTIPAHLNQTRNTTVSLVDQANAAIQKVSHLASVSALNDQGFLTEVEQAKNKADKTMNDLVRFDEQQTQSLSVIQDQLTSLNSLLSKVKAGFQNGSIQPGNVSELSALAKKAMTDSGGVSVFEKGIPTTLTRKEKQEKVIKEVGLEKLIQLQAMTPAEQLKEIHRLEKNSPYIREVLTQIQQDTAPANMKKLAELSPAEQAVELEKSPYLQALNDSSTVGMLTSQQILQNATGVEGMLMQSVMSQGQIRSVGTKKEATSSKKLTIQQKEKQVIKTVGLKQLKELEMMHPLDQKKKLEQLEKKAPHVKEVFKHIQKENSPKVQRDLAALSHSKAKLEKELKKYPYLYENYKKPEIARSVYEEEAKKQQQDGLAAVSFVADMVPVVSNVKGGWEASVGYDPITGNELSSFDRSVSGAGIVFGGFARVPGKVVKYGSEGAEYVLRVNKAEKTVTKHKVKDVSKGESKAVKKVGNPGGKADVAKGTVKYTGGRTQKELDDLAGDPSHGGRIEGQGIKEREIGLELESRGDLGRIIRDQKADKGAEFIDTVTEKKWDVKSFESYPNGHTSPKKGAFTVDNAMKKIKKEFERGHNVILDDRNLTPEHTKQLKEAIQKEGISDKIIWYP
ncbi:T7SS effector LXG polymorphic toxin [Priestia megaterium]|uniref:T7SS effector LXG polymorphic toxin n=1 Tax=Priestia megaterium TaxID=1404 RepID=UPI00203B6EAC|nr:T7SS effector LXG polymorphic toxin [Priestia megaterium]MCM3793778.1 T7SS effector LXG polymorphic toxin [Priestia megaterium]